MIHSECMQTLSSLTFISKNYLQMFTQNSGIRQFGCRFFEFANELQKFAPNISDIFFGHNNVAVIQHLQNSNQLIRYMEIMIFLCYVRTRFARALLSSLNCRIATFACSVAIVVCCNMFALILTRAAILSSEW